MPKVIDNFFPPNHPPHGTQLPHPVMLASEIRSGASSAQQLRLAAG